MVGRCVPQRGRGEDSRLALLGLLSPGPDRFEVLPLLDRRTQQLARAVGDGLRATLQLGRGPADEAARRAIAAAVEARVAMRAVHLECAVRLEEPHGLGFGDEHPRVDDHQYARTTDFFSR